MAKLHSSLLASGALSLASAFAQDAVPATPPVIPPAAPVSPAPIEPPIAIPNAPAVPPVSAGTSDAALVAPPPGANTSRLNEFQGDEIGLVLRTLARQGGMNVVVSDKVAASAGTVTMRLENKTAREALEVIVQDKGLFMSEINGVYFIKTQEEKAKEPTESASYTLSYAAAKDILPLLQGQLQSGLPPQFDQRTNTVFYREAKSNLEKITIFLDSIDKPTTQVMIDIADLLRGLSPEDAAVARTRLRRMAGSVAVFAAGCAAAALLYNQVNVWCFVVPPVLAACAVLLQRSTHEGEAADPAPPHR